jgi:hypothetical protein
MESIMRKRNIFIIAGLVILIPVLGLAWWLLSPLFISKTVDEEFPFAATAEIPADMTMAEVEQVMVAMSKMNQASMDEPMPPEIMDMPSASQREVIREAEVIKEVPKEVVKEVVVLKEVSVAVPAPSEPELISSGGFRDADSFHRGSGTATIYRLPDGSHLLRLKDFMVTNGPDLRVLLSWAPDPQSRDELQAGGYVHLAKLKGNRGNQNYEIPADIDPSAQGSVIIYCMPFHVIFSVASLEPGG